MRKEMEAMKLKRAEESAATASSAEPVRIAVTSAAPRHCATSPLTPSRDVCTTQMKPGEKSADLIAYEKKLEEEFEAEVRLLHFQATLVDTPIPHTRLPKAPALHPSKSSFNTL